MPGLALDSWGPVMGSSSDDGCVKVAPTAFSGLVLGLLIVGAFLSGCAGRSTLAGGGAGPGVATIAPTAPGLIATAVDTPDRIAVATSCAAGQGFALSLAAGSGAASPVLAVADFIRNGATPGFGDEHSRWQVVGGGPVAGEAVVVAGAVQLHVIQFDDGTWAVDSGQKCG
jgi:hypothetical protein